jgi:AraC-like DNA-binding protein
VGALDKPDNSVAAEPAHLLDPAHRAAIHMSRPAAGPEFAGLVRRFWMPVWRVPPGEVYTQRVLQYPVCLLVVTDDYARFYGPATGLTGTPLRGDGWAAGVMFEPAAGALLTGGEVARWTDGHVEVAEVFGPSGAALADRIRATMASDPVAAQTQSAVVEHYHDFLRGYLPVDEQGLLVNELVAWLRDHPEVTRVADLAEHMKLSERSLQRLVEQRVGLSPKWLIQRRRLHDAVEALKAGESSLADMAARLGYADQAHFTHDFRTVTGMTPGDYLRDQPRS